MLPSREVSVVTCRKGEGSELVGPYLTFRGLRIPLLSGAGQRRIEPPLWSLNWESLHCQRSPSTCARRWCVSSSALSRCLELGRRGRFQAATAQIPPNTLQRGWNITSHPQPTRCNPHPRSLSLRAAFLRGPFEALRPRCPSRLPRAQRLCHPDPPPSTRFHCLPANGGKLAVWSSSSNPCIRTICPWQNELGPEDNPANVLAGRPGPPCLDGLLILGFVMRRPHRMFALACIS